MFRRRKKVCNTLDVYSLSALTIYESMNDDNMAGLLQGTAFIDALKAGKKGDLKPLTELMFKCTSLVKPLEINYSNGYVDFIDYKK